METTDKLNKYQAPLFESDPYEVTNVHHISDLVYFLLKGKVDALLSQILDLVVGLVINQSSPQSVVSP